MVVVKGKSIAVAITAGAVLLAGVGFAAVEFTQKNDAAVPSASPTPENVDDLSTVEPTMIAEGLIQVEPPENVAAPSPAAVKQFGEASARQGIVWAESFAQYTAFLPNVWGKLLQPGGKVEDLTPEDYILLGTFMTQSGKQKLFAETGTVEALDLKGAGPTPLVVVPKTAPNRQWATIPVRPDGNSFLVKSTSVGPKSTYNDQPTLRVEFYDFHQAEFSEDGKPVTIEFSRYNVYDLAQTGNPDQPWLLDSWKVSSIRDEEITPQK